MELLYERKFLIEIPFYAETLLDVLVSNSVAKNRRLLTSLSYGLFSFLIAYCCISAVAGKAGILAYQDLVSQQKQIQKAIDYLQAQNQAKTNIIEI